MAVFNLFINNQNSSLMKLKKGTLILVSFVAVFFLGFSNLSAQKLNAASDNAGSTILVSTFETHVENYLPQSLTQYVVGKYQSFTAREINQLIRIAGEKTMVRSAIALKAYYQHVEDWINNYVPASDRSTVMAGLYSGGTFQTNNQ
jgi:hypothetical protein